MFSNNSKTTLIDTNIKPSEVVSLKTTHNHREESNITNDILETNKKMSVNIASIPGNLPILLVSPNISCDQEPNMKNQSMQKDLNCKVSQNSGYLCPHKAVIYLANIGAVEYENDRRINIWIQTRLRFVLLGILGGTKFEQFGYPNKSATEILEIVLCKTNTEVVKETVFCTEHCMSLCSSLDAHQLNGQLTKLLTRVLQLNIGKLLRICVPETDKWAEFGWEGKTVEYILEDLSTVLVPKK